jgi:uncharacterized protein
MIVNTYCDAAAFFRRVRDFLERQECLNNQVLGTCIHLAERESPPRMSPLLATVEEGQKILLVAVMTPPRGLVLAADENYNADAVDLLAQHLFSEDTRIPGVMGPGAVAGDFARAWSAQSGCRSDVDMRMRVYELRTVIPPAPVRGNLRVATEDDLELVTQWRFRFTEDANIAGENTEVPRRAAALVAARATFLWDVGEPVSMASTVRPTVHGIGIGGVYTPRELRRQGYASACMAALSQRLLDEGYQFCMLFADLSNPTSNALYQRIGYAAIGEFVKYTFS